MRIILLKLEFVPYLLIPASTSNALQMVHSKPGSIYLQSGFFMGDLMSINKTYQKQLHNR